MNNTELIARLRDIASKGVSVWGDLQMEAANALEAQAAEIKHVRQGWRCECSTDEACRFARERDTLRAELAAIEKTEPVWKVAIAHDMNDAFMRGLPIGTKLFTRPMPQEAGRAALAGAEPTGWIAAKDRMPPPQVRVLGFEPQYNIVDVDMWFGPDFNWGYSYWMPLPPAPKEQL